jgi:hypothetical protein
VGPGRPHPRQPRRLAGPGGIEPSLADNVKAVHQRLEQAQIPHAFGGAFALAYYGAPRETEDIDVNVFLPAQESELKLDWQGIPIHLFFSRDPLHEEMKRRVRLVPLDGDTIPLIAPEHLVVRKMLLDRPKDRRDIKQIAAAVTLDWEEIDHWVQQLNQEFK